MAGSVVEIYNLALSACGTDLGVTDPQENSREGAICRLWYPIVRDNVLAAAPWPSVRRYARLARINERDPDEAWTAGAPSPEFRYQYQAPENLLHPYHLQSFGRFAYIGRRISCAEEAPILFYNARETDVTAWDQQLSLAVAYMLAVHISIPLTGRGQRLEINAQLAGEIVMQAKIASANTQQRDEEILPDWITARGYGDGRPNKFVYPWASLNFETSR